MAVVYRGRVFSVDVEQTHLPDGRAHEVAIVRHPLSVVLIPIQADGRVVLVRQYRHPLAREIWELPAGSLEPGESAEAAAARECEEEIGLAPGRVQKIRGLYSTPGYCDEELLFFRATVLRPPAPTSRHAPDDDEDLHAQAFTVEQARAMVARGDIVDLKTAYGLTLLEAGEDRKSSSR
jgi:ADP-ribose pyrophosphatase